VRLALFGDVGGHRLLLADALTDLEADVDAGRLPDDLTVVQLGDLIDRGPDSAGCVALADRFMRASPGRWIQLLGNHEGNRVGGEPFWDEELDSAACQTLDSWWHDERASLAVAIDSVEMGEVVVTHGGVVRALWELLRRPDAPSLATTINGWVGARADLAFAPGQQLGSGAVPGPVWPDAGAELYPSWVGQSMPFSQVHGHSSIYEWPEGRPRPHLAKAVRKLARADPTTRREIVDIDGRTLVGIDPTLGFSGADKIHPLILHGDVLVP